jgi:hypothetical protein
MYLKSGSLSAVWKGEKCISDLDRRIVHLWVRDDRIFIYHLKKEEIVRDKIYGCARRISPNIEVNVNHLGKAIL